nr:alpha/beta hydrolases superfamily protein [Tanacetum cinerariifolium]
GQIHHKREIIQNKYKENLVGILHETGSKEVVIVCHGYRSCKDKIPMVNRGIEGRLGKDYLKRMKQYGIIDVANRK